MLFLFTSYKLKIVTLYKTDKKIQLEEKLKYPILTSIFIILVLFQYSCNSYLKPYNHKTEQITITNIAEYEFTDDNLRQVVEKTISEIESCDEVPLMKDLSRMIYIRDFSTGIDSIKIAIGFTQGFLYLPVFDKNENYVKDEISINKNKFKVMKMSNYYIFINKSENSNSYISQNITLTSHSLNIRLNRWIDKRGDYIHTALNGLDQVYYLENDTSHLIFSSLDCK